jgi:hypothetical protein
VLQVVLHIRWGLLSKREGADILKQLNREYFLGQSQSSLPRSRE